MPLLRSIGVRQPIPDPVLRDTANNKAEESDCLVREKRDGGTDLTCLRDWMIGRQPFLFGLQRQFPLSTDQEQLLVLMKVTSGTYYSRITVVVLCLEPNPSPTLQQIPSS